MVFAALWNENPYIIVLDFFFFAYQNKFCLQLDIGLYSFVRIAYTF